MTESGPCPDVGAYTISEHARLQMARRGVPEAWVDATLRTPGQRQPVRPGRCVFQSAMPHEDESRDWLLRVFVDVDRDPAEVVTVYLTSKLAKYWR